MAPWEVDRRRLLSRTGWLTVDRKYRDHWTGKLPTRLVVLTNELPRLDDVSGSLASRFIILTLTRSFSGHGNPPVTEDLCDELPGVFKRALDGLDRVNDRGRSPSRTRASKRSRNSRMSRHPSARSSATGRPIRPCLISVMAERDEFDQLHLDAPELDPQRCLRHLNAIMSPHPYDLEAVRPVAEFDLSKYKFVLEMQVAAGLDGRPDLLDLTPTEFGTSSVSCSRPPACDRGLPEGILITTSWFGKGSYKFAARNGRIQLIDGRGLIAMMQEQLGRDVLIGLPNSLQAGLAATSP